MKIEFIDGISNFGKFWSVRLSVIGSTLTAAALAFPTQVVEVWTLLPNDVKQMIPAEYAPMIGVTVSLMSLVARALKQGNLNADCKS